jgi:hypothetical protein
MAADETLTLTRHTVCSSRSSPGSRLLRQHHRRQDSHSKAYGEERSVGVATRWAMWSRRSPADREDSAAERDSSTSFEDGLRRPTARSPAGRSRPLTPDVRAAPAASGQLGGRPGARQPEARVEARDQARGGGPFHQRREPNGLRHARGCFAGNVYLASAYRTHAPHRAPGGAPVTGRRDGTRMAFAPRVPVRRRGAQDPPPANAGGKVRDGGVG